MEVLVHLFPVPAVKGHHLAQLIEGVHIFKYLVPLPEPYFRHYSGVSGGQMAVFLIYPSLSLFGSRVSCRHCPPGYEHVTLIAPGVVSRSLVEYHNYLLHVPVHEIQLEFGVTGIPP